MKFVHAPNGVFRRVVKFGQVVEFSPTCKATARQLTPAQKEQYGVTFLKLTTPPTHNPDTQNLEEIAPVMVNGVWVQQWEVTSIVPTDAVDLAVFKRSYASKRKVDLAAIRYEKETAGIVFNGIRVATDRESQAMLTGAYTTVQIKPDIIINWKGDTGWVQLNKVAIESLSQAVSTHIQACFTNEQALSALIDAAATVADLEAIDLYQGWGVL